MRHWKQSRLSITQKTEIWSRWKSGQFLHVLCDGERNDEHNVS